jgi:hypothetical protein
VDAPLGLGGGNPLDTVGTAFVFETAVHPFALDQGHNLLEAAHTGGVVIHHLYLPVAALGITAVHFIEVAGKQAGFVAAGTGPDFQQNVLLIQGIFGDQQLLELLFQAFFFPFQAFDLLFGQIFDLRIIIPEQLEALVELGIDLLIGPEGLNDFRYIGMLAGIFLVGRAILQHIRIAQQGLQLAEPFFNPF